ncbi:F-box domain, Galactose oxidase/kelch, beta-propeller [Artemisia annua]|uniref:F-box domain, Galactose oxidase/kelch, beta-propeller n=1 Tax=Artemisia annua TaxID=35608 RepID=A0A2U1NS07_ARTAN|nr:F-box domain, Galactose oxidase/kelch, beta-propeller [Artemisia annua]
MKTYGEKGSWVKEYVIDLPILNIYRGYNFFRSVICKSNGKVVMVSEKGYILFYNLLNKTSRVVSHPALQHSEVVVHTPSFKSLRDVTNGSNLVVVNVLSRTVCSTGVEHTYLTAVISARQQLLRVVIFASIFKVYRL